MHCTTSIRLTWACNSQMKSQIVQIWWKYSRAMCNKQVNFAIKQSKVKVSTSHKAQAQDAL